MSLHRGGFGLERAAVRIAGERRRAAGGKVGAQRQRRGGQPVDGQHGKVVLAVEVRRRARAALRRRGSPPRAAGHRPPHGRWSPPVRARPRSRFRSGSARTGRRFRRSSAPRRPPCSAPGCRCWHRERRRAGPARSRRTGWGCPSPITAERNWAMDVFSGVGVTPSMNPITLDSASCWETKGTPRALMLNASMDITRADTTTFTPPPTTRSAARSGLDPDDAADPPPDHGAQPVAQHHQQDGGGHDRRQPPAAVIHQLADERYGQEGGHGAGREARDAAERHQEAVAQAIDQVGQQRQNQRQVQNGQAEHRGSSQTVSGPFYWRRLTVSP